jgi:hypothetical protein
MDGINHIAKKLLIIHSIAKTVTIVLLENV